MDTSQRKTLSKNFKSEKRLEEVAVFFDQNRESLLRIAKSFANKALGDIDAEDVVQEAWLRLSATRMLLDSHDSKYWMGAFIGTIRRVAIDCHRKNTAAKRGGGSVARDVKVDALETKSNQGGEDLFDLIDSVLTHLSPRQREIFDLSYYSGLGPAQVAKKLKVSQRTVELDREVILERLLPRQ